MSLERTSRILAGAGAVSALLAILIYQKPQSFYVNYIIFPSAFLWLLSCALGLAAAICAAILALKKPSWANAPPFLIGLAAPVIAILIITWRANG